MTSENLLELSNSQTKNEDSLAFNDTDDILNSLWNGGLSATGSTTVGTWDELERDFGYSANDDAFIQSLGLNDVVRNNSAQQHSEFEQSDQFTRQVEQQIQREVLQHQESMQKQIREFQEQQQRSQQQSRHSSANDIIQFPSYEDFSQPSASEEEEQLKMFAQQKGMNLAGSQRKRKSEDMTESFNSLSVKTENDSGEFVITAAPSTGSINGSSSNIQRRNSLVNNSNTPITPNSSGSNISISRSGSISGELDVSYAKGQLLDMACGEKEMLSYCTKATNFICSYTKVRIGGFYVNQRSSIEDWLLYYAFPSSPIFTTFFHFNVGFNLLLQASVEKRCFCVHSTAINSGSLSFMFVPIPVEDVNNALAVLVLGTILNTDDEMHNQLLFLDQVRKTVSASMAAILSLQQNNALSKKVEVLKLENEVLKQKNRFERALIGVMASVGGYISGNEGDVAILCCDTMGIISYFSQSAQNLLGYTSAEIVGRYSPLKFHDPSEIHERARELEMEYGKKVQPGFQVITEKTLRNGGMEETRDWTYIRKEGTPIRANVTIKPLYDEEDSSIIGFLSIAKQVQ